MATDSAMALLKATRLSLPLRNANYGIYTAGNAVSLIGTWMQRISIGWLTWELTHSGFWLGLVAFAEQRAGACRDSQAPCGAGRQRELSKPSHGGRGPLGLAAADGCLDQLGQREVREGQVVALFAGKLR